jgi:regulator of RNase E activity RraA
MTTQFKALGVVGVVTDGPMRDYLEIKELKVQYLATGLTSGHGPLAVRGVNIPVKVAGMAVSPGDIIHMDMCGACKFPASKLSKVLEYAIELRRREREQQRFFCDPNFTLAKWKASAKS